MEVLAATTTFRDLLERAQASLRKAQVETPRLDAEVLLAACAGMERAKLYARFGNAVDEDTQARFQAALERRELREPVAYITGMREFWSLPFRVSRDVLIPRPETELLVETASTLLKGTSRRACASGLPYPSPRDCRPLVCDVGTGSGCIAVAIAQEVPAASVTATDVSPVALSVARRNAEVNGVADRIAFVCGDLFEGLDSQLKFDVIVSNPPYVADDEHQPPENDWEPPCALSGGRDGLVVIRELLRAAPSQLRHDGWLLMEFGYNQAATVLDLAAAAGFETRKVCSDLAGMPRMLMASPSRQN